jgi:tetratricopeptide (TPR) repeat protein
VGAPPAPEEILAGLAEERYERLIRGSGPEAPPAPGAGPDERTVEQAEESVPLRRNGEETPARLRLVVGDYRRLVDDFEAGRLDDLDDTGVIAWAYVMLGNEDAKRALAAFGPEGEPFWASATGNYAAALRIDPRHADAFYNWASAAANRAQGLKGAASERLWNEAVSHFERALEVRPDDTEALGDCARALVAKARTMTAPRADELLDRALDLLAHAYRLGDDMAYVGYFEVALAHARHGRLVEFMNERPKRLSDTGYFALALAQVVFTLECSGSVDLAPFDALPARDEAPCGDWDFAEIEPALPRLPAADAGFVRDLIAILQGARPSGDWPSLRDSWIAVNPARTPVFSAGSG